MKNPEDAEKLARSMVDTGSAMGKKIIALLTDMDEPLGSMVGNFLEVEECLDCLEGVGLEASGDSAGSADLMEVTLELAARMLILGGKAKDAAQGRTICEEALAGGKPRELFLQNITSQGGDVKKFLGMRGSYRSQFSAEIKAAQGGYISRIDAWKIGHAGVGLGVGRNRTEDPVSPTAGIQFFRKRGAAIKQGDPIMRVWGKDQASLEAALPQLAEAVEYSKDPPGKRTLILKEIAR
jgi:pyrimidine-nucleoside phosphorylase